MEDFITTGTYITSGWTVIDTKTFESKDNTWTPPLISLLGADINGEYVITCDSLLSQLKDYQISLLEKKDPTWETAAMVIGRFITAVKSVRDSRPKLEEPKQKKSWWKI